MRLVSLCPSITESLVALGAGAELVGVTRYCVRPREAVSRIPKVGGTKNPDLAAIRAAAPDLVFANGEENRKEDVEALAREFTVDVSHPRTVAEVPALLRHFGRLTGTEGKAERIASKVEEEAGRMGSASHRSFRYVYLIWKDPWMTVGPRTYIADVLRLAGGVLAIEAKEGSEPDYPSTDEDQILSSRPDVVILPDEPYRFGERDASFWRSRLPASGRVVCVAGDDFCWHGVRTLEGLAAAEALSNGFGAG